MLRSFEPNIQNFCHVLSHAKRPLLDILLCGFLFFVLLHVLEESVTCLREEGHGGVEKVGSVPEALHVVRHVLHLAKGRVREVRPVVVIGEVIVVDIFLEGRDACFGVVTLEEFHERGLRVFENSLDSGVVGVDAFAHHPDCDLRVILDDPQAELLELVGVVVDLLGGLARGLVRLGGGGGGLGLAGVLGLGLFGGRGLLDGDGLAGGGSFRGPRVDALGRGEVDVVVLGVGEFDQRALATGRLRVDAHNGGRCGAAPAMQWRGGGFGGGGGVAGRVGAGACRHSVSVDGIAAEFSGDHLRTRISRHTNNIVRGKCVQGMSSTK